MIDAIGNYTKRIGSQFWGALLRFGSPRIAFQDRERKQSVSHGQSDKPEESTQSGFDGDFSLDDCACIAHA